VSGCLHRWTSEADDHSYSQQWKGQKDNRLQRNDIYPVRQIYTESTRGRRREVTTITSNVKNRRQAHYHGAWYLSAHSSSIIGCVASVTTLVLDQLNRLMAACWIHIFIGHRFLSSSCLVKRPKRFLRHSLLVSDQVLIFLSLITTKTLSHHNEDSFCASSM
jgi:hypothetical protein